MVVSAADVNLHWVGEDQTVLDERGNVGHHHVWVGGRGRGRGAHGVEDAVEVVITPIASVSLVFVAFVVPFHCGVV